MSKHTHYPGPWNVSEGDGFRIEQEDMGGIAYVIEPPHGGNREDADFAIARATARLIAAAPSLLDALKDLVGLAEMRGAHLHEYTAALDAARAAIEKA